MKTIRWAVLAGAAMAALTLGGCASLGVGLSVPLGRAAGVGVSLGSDGQVGVGLGVGRGIGRGGASVGVGGTAQLPSPLDSPPRTVNRGAPQWE